MLRTLDDVETYLRKIDETYDVSTTNCTIRREIPRNSNDGFRRYYGNQNASNAAENKGERNVQNVNSADKVREVHLLTKFNEEEEESDSDILISPCIEVTIGHEVVEALVDSGSQISPISEEFGHYLRVKNLHLPLLPISNTAVSVAIGIKQLKVRKQVLLTVMINSIVHEVECVNSKTKS